MAHRGGGEWGQLGEPQHVRKPHRREALRLDRLQVPAAALDVEDRLLLAEEILFADLDRGVAPSVQHQRLVAAEKARRVHAQTEVALELPCFPVAPKTLHSRLP